MLHAWEASDDPLNDAPVHVDKESGAIDFDWHRIPFKVGDVECVRCRDVPDEEPAGQADVPGRHIRIYLARPYHLTLVVDEDGTFFEYDLELIKKGLWSFSGEEDTIAYGKLNDLAATSETAGEGG